MTRNYRTPYIALLLVTAVSIAFADLFPAREGNWWRYRYTVTSGLAGATRADSGTVQWSIFKMLPGNDTYWIEMQQRRDLIRSTTTLVTYPPVIIDSVFNPPRSTIDTVTLTGKYGGNGLAINGDNCYPLLHQPLCWSADPSCTLRTVPIDYHGKTIIGYIIDPVACPLQACAPARTFTQADGIGLVAFESSSSSQPACIGSTLTHEQWTLVDHYVPTRWITPDTATAGSAVTLMLSTLEYSCMPDSFVKSMSIDAGRISLAYRPVYNPLRSCVSMYELIPFITYRFTAPPAGSYPVFAESQPSCYPLCLPPSIIECIDTLVVTGAVSAERQAAPFPYGTLPRLRKSDGAIVLDGLGDFNGREARLLDAKGRCLGHASVVAGKAVFDVRRLLGGKVVFITIGKVAAWRCVVQ